MATRCVDWLAQLDTGEYPAAVNLRPAVTSPDTAHVTVDLARVRLSWTALPLIWMSWPAPAG